MMSAPPDDNHHHVTRQVPDVTRQVPGLSVRHRTDLKKVENLQHKIKALPSFFNAL
jgi:hypothetical protein